VNENLVRDDVEREIAKNIKNKAEYELAFSYGKFLCQMSSFQITGTMEDVKRVAALIPSGDSTQETKDKLGTEILIRINKIVLNTKDRDDRYNKALSFMFNPESSVEAKKCNLSSTIFDIAIPPEISSETNNSTVI
jgi:hypothetical protein